MVNETFLLGLVVGGLIAALMAVRMTPGTGHVQGLPRLEAKLDALLKHQGIQFDFFADLPARVVDALRRGEKIEAIKEYRAATGAGLAEAKEHIEGAQRRGLPRA
jgi:hypothetical protein